MRAYRTAVLILGLFTPLVIQAQPFGDTDVTVFDVEFLAAPPGPPPGVPAEPPMPAWVAVYPEAVVPDRSPPPIPLPEFPS